MFAKPTKALMTTLQRFVFRHEIFVEAREFDDGLIFVREPKGRARKPPPNRPPPRSETAKAGPPRGAPGSRVLG